MSGNLSRSTKPWRSPWVHCVSCLESMSFLWTMGFRIPVKWKYVQQHLWCFLRYHLADQNFNWCLASLNWEYRAVSSKLHILQLQLSASKVRARSSSFSCTQTNSGVQQWISIEWRFGSPVWQDLWLDDWKSGSRPGFGIISHCAWREGVSLT